MLGLKMNIAQKWNVNPLALNAIKGKVFFSALLLVAVTVIVPLFPAMPWDGLDPSWQYGMNESLAQGMSFGKDIIFTFGPYASIYTRAYHPATDKLMIWGAFYLAISFSVAAYLNFRLSGWLLKFYIFAILSALSYVPDALFFFYPMLVGAHIYRWVILFDSGRDERPSDMVLKVVLFFPFGLFLLIKGSMLFACAAIYFLSIALLAKRKQWKLCLMIGATPLVSLVIFWTLSGQPLIGVADYFAGLAPIISGYTEAMATNGDPIEYILYAVAVVALVFLLIREAQGSTYDKLLVTLMFLCILFLGFKAGFVRHDGHAIISGAMILFLGVLAGTLLTVRSSLALLFFCFISWGYIDAAHIKTSSYGIKENIKATYSNAWVGFKQRIMNSDALRRDFEVRVNEINKRGAIPKLNGSADIYSYDQSYLIASGNKWNPRPIFQSYSVYTTKLAEINKMHLLSENRPENIFFKVQPIDGRLPSLEDGASWPVLLSNYEPSSFTDGYLFLKNRHASSQAYEEPTKIGGGVYSLGKQINLPDSDVPLYVKLNIRKSFVGAILNTLFKPSQLVIKLTMRNGFTRDYRIIAGMSESGFVISPLVENTEDLGLFFSGVNNLNDKRVKSIKIVAPRSSFFWEKSFEINFYKFNFQSSPGFIERMGFVMPRVEGFVKTSSAQGCDGSIDVANGISPIPDSISATSRLNINGWLAASVSLAEVPEKVYLVLSNAEGRRYFIDAKRTQRLDVGAYFNKPAMNLSGYEAKANVSNLIGSYHLGLAFLRDNELFICPQFHVPIKLNQD